MTRGADMSVATILSENPAVVVANPFFISDRIDPNPFKPEYIYSDEALDQFSADGGVVKTLGVVLKKGKDGLSGGATPLGANYMNDGVRFIRTGEVNDCWIDGDSCVFISSEDDQSIKRSKLQADDVLLTITGACFGKSAKVTSKLLPANISQHSVRMRTKELVNPSFLTAYLNSNTGQLQVFKQTVGSTRQAVDYIGISKIRIPIPDQQIQTYIAQKIDLSEKCRETATAYVSDALSILESELGGSLEDILGGVKQKGIFENGGFSVTVEPDLIRNRLDPIGYHPELLSIQKTFHLQKSKYRRLGNHIKLTTNERRRVNSSSSYFVSVLHVDNKGYLDRGAASEYYPESPGREAKPDDILVSCINPAANRIAVCDDMKGTIACSPEFAILESKELPPHYLAFVLRSDLVYRQMIHLGKGTSSSRRRIDEEELLDLEIPVVSRADEIATLIKKRQKLISIAFQLTTEAKADVEALIEGKLDNAAIMSGKLKAPTWEDIEKELEGI